MSIPKRGEKAPPLTLRDERGRPVKLEDFRGKNVVLCFYPADFSPVCSSELSLIQETLEEIKQLDGQVLGVSCDSPYTHRAWSKLMGFGFPLLSDFWPHGDAARRYGIFLDDRGIANRAIFFLDKEGALYDMWLADDPDVAPPLNVIFKTLRDLYGDSEETHAP
jgi:peroxiredoxin